MGCVPCGAKRLLASQKFVWTDGVNTVIYDTEVAAKTKVRKRGGTYGPYNPAPAEVTTDSA